jgi:membrane-bound lytic murein transglycosylase D
LKLVKFNKYQFINAGLLAGFLFLYHELKAQPDSLQLQRQSRLIENIGEMSMMSCFGDSTFNPGKFRPGFAENPAEFYQQLHLPVFTSFTIYASDWYQAFSNLSLDNKQKLLRYFSAYEDYFDKALTKAGLPVELKYVAPAVSGMNMMAAGENIRAGLFQLTHFQAVLNGLQVNQLVDERLNPHLAVKAFAAELKKNQSVFKNSELALLGYFCGNTCLQNAIGGAGNGADINRVLALLPAEALQLIGAYQAAVLFFGVNKYKKEINPLVRPVVPDTVIVSRQVHFQQIAQVLGISNSDLAFLNPQYRFGIIPGNVKPAKLALPKGFRDDFVFLQDSVYNVFDSTLFAIVTPKIVYPPAPGRQYGGEPVKNLTIEGKTKIKYILKSGDILGVVAEKYDVSVEDLKYWNNINNERKIQAGKTIDIFVDNEKAVDYAKAENPVETTKTKPKEVVIVQKSPLADMIDAAQNGKKVEHVVKDGESPYTIAKKYNGVSPDDILKWNNIQDARKIQPGQKLVVYLSN